MSISNLNLFFQVSLNIPLSLGVICTRWYMPDSTSFAVAPWNSAPDPAVKRRSLERPQDVLFQNPQNVLWRYYLTILETSLPWGRPDLTSQGRPESTSLGRLLGNVPRYFPEGTSKDILGTMWDRLFNVPKFLFSFFLHGKVVEIKNKIL